MAFGVCGVTVILPNPCISMRGKERRGMGRAVAVKASDTKFPGKGFAHFMTVQMEMQWS